MDTPLASARQAGARQAGARQAGPGQLRAGTHAAGRLLLAGDAAHTVPPTGAKGLNLALADARVLAECLERAVAKDDPDALDEYPRRALGRVWKAQYFSYWMTTLLHRLPGGDEFDERRQLAELGSVVDSAVGSTYLAEAYTGWPSLTG